MNTLISLSLKEEELTSSLENVGEQLFQAYSTLQSAYTEVQRLQDVKQEVHGCSIPLHYKLFTYFMSVFAYSKTKIFFSLLFFSLVYIYIYIYIHTQIHLKNVNMVKKFHFFL